MGRHFSAQSGWAFAGAAPPAALYEAGFCIVLVIGLYLIWRHYKAATPRGLIFGLFVVLLFTQRFLLEFLKENQVPFENGLPLNMGQLLRACRLSLTGVIVLARAVKRGPQLPAASLEV